MFPIRLLFVNTASTVLSLWPSAITIVLLLLLASKTTEDQKQQQPNIVLFIADDLGWGDLGCNGNTTLRTPNIDRLATDGIRFSHALSAASLCTPSRTAIMTGRYPIRAGMASSGLTRVIPFLAMSGGLPPTEKTFARVAKEQGYSTALIGKWHLGLHCTTSSDFCHHPSSHGFDVFYGLPWSNAQDFGGKHRTLDSFKPHLRQGFLITAIVGLATLLLVAVKRPPKTICGLILLLILVLIGIIVPFGLWAVTTNLRILNGILMRDRQVVEQPIRIEGLHKRFVREAEEFVSSSHRIGQPFLLVLSFTHVHTVLSPTPEFKGRSLHGTYGDSVEELDWAIGQFLKHLDDLNIASNTFVAFTSDHGGHLEEVNTDGQREGGHNGPFKGGKGMDGTEGGIRVPLLFRWPLGITSTTNISMPVSHMDLYPTIVALTGAKRTQHPELDGVNLLPLLTANQEKGKSFEGELSSRLLVHYCGTHIHAARWIENETEVYKVLYATPNFLPNTNHCRFVCSCVDVTWHKPPIIYDIQRDPSEERPIATNDPKYKEVLATVTNRLESHRASVVTVPNQLQPPRSMWLPWLQPCCQLPYCQCLEEKYT